MEGKAYRRLAFFSWTSRGVQKSIFPRSITCGCEATNQKKIIHLGNRLRADALFPFGFNLLQIGRQHASLLSYKGRSFLSHQTQALQPISEDLSIKSSRRINLNCHIPYIIHKTLLIPSHVVSSCIINHPISQNLTTLSLIPEVQHICHLNLTPGSRPLHNNVNHDPRFPYLQRAPSPFEYEYHHFS